MSKPEKPQVVSNSESLTDTVVSSTQQGVTTTSPVATTRSYNAYGIQNIRGGNILGTSFLDSILSAYTNLLSYNPVAVFALAIATYYYVSKIIGNVAADPFTLMAVGIANKTESLENGPVKAISVLFAGIFRFLDTHKPFFALIFMFGSVYLSKPSTRNAITSGGFIFACLMFKFTFIMILALGHCYFLYTQFRDPKHKSIIVIIALACIFIGSSNMAELVGMDSIRTAYGVKKGG